MLAAYAGMVQSVKELRHHGAKYEIQDRGKFKINIGVFSIPLWGEQEESKQTSLQVLNVHEAN